MSKVDEALEWFGISQQGPEYSEQYVRDGVMGNILAAEVRRLREERARLLDDAVERAIAWWRKGHPYNYKAHEAELRAAIKGAAHE